jgi:PAS domain S-box-containing protein
VNSEERSRVPLYEIVLRREGFADEIRLTDHAGFSVGDSIHVERYECLVSSTDEISANPMVAQRVVCTLALATPLVEQLQRQKLLGEVLEGFRAAAFVFDVHGKLAAVNEAAVTMTGYSRAKLSALDSTELMAEPASGPALLAAVVAGSLRFGDGAIRQKDGTLLPVRFHIDTTTLAGKVYFLSLCWPLP